jgi:hypothetical protein
MFVLLVNFKIMILNSNAWLFSIPSNVILPNELQLIFDHFNKFYKRMHNGRKLSWLHQYSKGELQTGFTKKIYTLKVRICLISLGDISSIYRYRYIK